MRIQIKNIGQIEDASVDLDGITVIAGENNTGKSTIGKTVFALLRGMDEWKELYFSLCEKNVKAVMEKKSQLLEEFCLAHTNAYRRRTNRANELLNELCTDGNFIVFIEDHQVVGDDKVYSRLKEYCRDYIALYQKNDAEQMINSHIKFINGWMEEVIEELNQIELDEVALQSGFVKNSFHSCFKGQYITEGEECSEVLFTDTSRTTVLKLSASASSLSAPIRFEPGVYFIESPKIFDEIGPAVQGRDALKMLMIPNTFLNTAVRKRTEQQISLRDTYLSYLEDEIPKEAEQVLAMLCQAMNGKADYYAKEGIKFKENGAKGTLYPQNVSTGVKALAVLEYTVRLGVIQKKDILILDEPEINLHPQWQIVYARALVLLQKAYGLTLIITTHSPYFLRALECFTDKYGVMDQLNVYYVSKDDGHRHRIKNMMNSEYGMTELYEILSSAFDQLQDEIDSLYAEE